MHRTCRWSPLCSVILLILATNLIAQERSGSPWDNPDPKSPWSGQNPDSPWDTIDPLSPWDNPNAGASWKTEKPFTGSISGRWKSSYSTNPSAPMSLFQVEQSGDKVRIDYVENPRPDNTTLGTRRGHYIIVTEPVGGFYECPKGTRQIPVHGATEIGVSDDGNKMTLKYRDWDLTGEAPNCKVRLKDTWYDGAYFYRVASVKELRYVEQRGDQFVPVASELKHGSPFYVEAVFDIPPPEDEFPVKLSWGEEESTEIPVRRSSDARTFRSEAITLQPPAVNQ